MCAELKENYEWALNFLKTLYSPTCLPTVIVTDNELALIIFPNAKRLQCTWHIQKNAYSKFLAATTKEKIELENDWGRVIRSETVTLFDMALDSFVQKYDERYPEAIKYIHETVLANKEYFAYAWTNEIRYYGIRTTNRVEGAHNIFKQYLENSRGGFIECWKHMHNMFRSHLVVIKAAFQKSINFRKHEHNIAEFRGLHHHVSQYALDKICLQLARLKKMRSMCEIFCGCILWKTYGLPCAHMLLQYRSQGMPIPLSAIDSQWRQLNLVPPIGNEVAFDYLPQVEILKNKWVDFTEVEKLKVT
ncbi:hypothetical protein MKW98_018045 [Papaver atlanticum]|uniref:Protein FAR1-RELATED SEQUENCE n=1 Tax=Papaver atlanticum TaxID=357466 RepID=A0AAD4TFN8_9MAGN|nr:hypothetical protein MKW98_018045 [Papaver atlanticum]